MEDEELLQRLQIILNVIGIRIDDENEYGEFDGEWLNGLWSMIDRLLGDLIDEE